MKVMIRGCCGCLGNNDVCRFSSSSAVTGVIASHGSSLLDLILFSHIRCQWAVNSVLRCPHPSNVQLCRVGLRQMTWGLQKASKSWWKNSSQLSLMYPFFPPLWAGMCLPSPSRAFLYSCLRLSFVLSIYLQLPVIGFLLLVFLCLLLQDNYMNWD